MLTPSRVDAEFVRPRRHPQYGVVSWLQYRWSWWGQPVVAGHSFATLVVCMKLCGTRWCTEPITNSTTAGGAGGSCHSRFARTGATTGSPGRRSL